jgi:hypothetical protein
MGVHEQAKREEPHQITKWSLGESTRTDGEKITLK